MALDLSPLPPIPPIVAEIIAGVLIGPQVLDLVRLSAPLEVFADVGLVFLFFLAGLEIAFDARGGRHLGLVGLAFLASLGLAVVVALAFEALELVEAPVLVAIVLAATSFGIVVAVLKDAHRTESPFGQLVIIAASMADFATVILLSLFFSQQGSSAESTLVLLLLFGALVALIGLVLAGARGSGRLTATVQRLHETSAQIGVRIAFLLLAGLVLMAQEFGLEVVLGAFMAGAMVSLLDRNKAVASYGLQSKLEGVGFGVFIPVFFVTSGAVLDLDSLFSSFGAALLVPATVAALLCVRAAAGAAVPALPGPPRDDRRRTAPGHVPVLHRRGHPDRCSARSHRGGHGRRARGRRSDLGAGVSRPRPAPAGGGRARLASGPREPGDERLQVGAHRFPGQGPVEGAEALAGGQDAVGRDGVHPAGIDLLEAARVKLHAAASAQEGEHVRFPAFAGEARDARRRERRTARQRSPDRRPARAAGCCPG